MNAEPTPTSCCTATRMLRLFHLAEKEISLKVNKGVVA
jgi:hypothetical protein